MRPPGPFRQRGLFQVHGFMSDTSTTPTVKTRVRVERPKLYKVILVNDDFTPREFVVRLLKVEFRLDEAQAQTVMMTAHQLGACVVAVYARDVAETKATRAIDASKRAGHPLQFNLEPE